MTILPTILATAGMALMSQSALSAAMVNVAHFAPFFDDIGATAVDIAINGKLSTLEDVKFPMYNASQLTRPFPCVDAE